LGLCVLWAAAAGAGSNAGFGVSLVPAQISGAAVGDTIDFAVEIAEAVEAKHVLVVARYDSTLFAFVDFVPGALIADLQAPAGIPEADTLSYVIGELAFGAVRRFANKLFNFAVDRRHDGASIVWESRWPGIEDTLRYRAVGDTLWMVMANALFLRFF
jgi:hypothetical protein